MSFSRENWLGIVDHWSGRGGDLQASWKRFPLHGFVASNLRQF